MSNRSILRWVRFPVLSILAVALLLHVALGWSLTARSAEPEVITRNQTLILGRITRNQTLILGRITRDPKKDYSTLKPMVTYVVQGMKKAGITHGEVVLAKDVRQMVRLLKAGQVDWVTETIFSAFAMAENAGAEFLLRRWKKGVAEYQSVFITEKSNPIQDLNELVGKKIAFEDAGSTSAYLIPAAMIKRHGISLVKLDTPRSAPPPGKAGYFFSGGEINIAMAVIRGLADVGAYSNLDWETPKSTPPALKKRLRIFHRSPWVPRGVELVRKDLDPAIKSALEEVLLNAHSDPAAKKALHAYQGTKKFDRFEGDAVINLDKAHALLPLVDALVEK